MKELANVRSFSGSSAGTACENIEQRVAELEKQLEFYKMIAASAYASLRFVKNGGTYFFNLANPKTFNEKCIWLREHYWTRHPLNYYKTDKYFFKYFMEKLFGKKHILPLLGVWDSADDIDFDGLPEKFVLKRTLSGGSYEVKLVDKAKDDLEQIRRIVKPWLMNPKRIKARIIAERMLDPYIDESGNEYILDYKFFVINGKVCFVDILKMSTRGGRRYGAWYKPDLTRIPVVSGRHPSFKPPFPQKDMWQSMIKYAEEVGKIFPVIRVDMYTEKDNYYIGELTDVHNNGTVPINPAKYDKLWGKMIKLPSEDEMQADFARAYELFPELKENPVFMESTMNVCKIIWPGNQYDELPTPPLPFMQPMKRKYSKQVEIQIADMNAKDKGYQEVLWAVSNRICILGKSKKFNPNGLVRKLDIAVYMWRMAGRPIYQGTPHNINDIAVDFRFRKAIEWGLDRKIFFLDKNGNFNPGRHCSRLDVIVYLCRRAGSHKDEFEIRDITDYQEGAFINNVLWALEKGIVSLDMDGKLYPDSLIDRKTMAAFLYNSMKDVV